MAAPGNRCPHCRSVVLRDELRGLGAVAGDRARIRAAGGGGRPVRVRPVAVDMPFLTV